jgi:protein-disulfide isomerase
VTIVEFSDFQCGHCAKATRVLKEVLPRYSGQVRVIFRHYPLDRACNSALQGQVHELACAAAVAAECAAEQGRFWEYHDLLFANQSRFDAESLASYARGLRLDMTAFSQCIAGAEARAKVARDVEQGNRLGIESTPTLFLNGRTVRGSLDADLLRQAINIERAKPS